MPMPSDEDPPSNTMKRLPLTPIPVDGPFPADDDVKSTASTSNAVVSGSHSDDELRPSLYQRRKSSVPALTLGKPPYSRRRSHNRRPSPVRHSPSVPPSLTPVHTTFHSERRTSLPALHFHETDQNVTSLHLDVSPSRRDSISEDIYGGLQSFTFGAPPSQVRSSSDESDEDERQRRDRAKMRAIDDGTRRPSLPTNDSTPSGPHSRQSFSSMASSVAPSLGSSAHIVVGEQQWDRRMEPDWDVVMGDITPTESSPPLPTPASGHTTPSRSSSPSGEFRRPSLPIQVPIPRRRSRSAEQLASDFERIRGATPTHLSSSTPSYSWPEGDSAKETRATSSSPEENALDGFDMNYILSPPSIAEADRRLQRQTSSGRLRSKFRHKPTNANDKIQGVEDTFTGHLGQYDPVYERRKREWSFRREIRPTNRAVVRKVKDKDRSVHSHEEYERWRCELIGSFVISKSMGNSTTQHTDGHKVMYDRLHIVHTPDSSNKGYVGPRVLVHRHSRARAYSIFRSHSLPKKVMIPTDSVLMGVKRVLREYTRTESTRALKTHGLIDDEDSKPPHIHSERGTNPSLHAGISRQAQPQSEKSRQSQGNTGLESGISIAFETKKSSNSPGPHSQTPEVRQRKDSTRTLMSSTSSSSRSGSTSRPSSIGVSRGHVILDPSSTSVHRDGTRDTSPRTSTSHAEAFAMRDVETREVDTHNHHREGISNGGHGPASTTPSPPHGQTKVLGFGERIKRAFGSSKQQHHLKDGKEPVSPSTEDEDEIKTANQDGKFAPPWLTVARRSEKEQHDRMIRTLNNSFESVGLIPPQDKKKPSKPRHKSKNDHCAIFEDVPEDSMCMLLPLWPGETSASYSSNTKNLSRNSSRSARHATSHSMGGYSGVCPIPLEQRKFLLVYYTPFVESLEDDGNKGSNNKKRRRPHTAGDHPPINVTNIGSSSSFAVVARLLEYKDVRTSGVRLPEKGLAITGSFESATNSLPSPSVPSLSSLVIAQCHGPENGVELVQEGLESLGLMDRTAPRGVDVNGDPTGVKLSEVGRAVVEMVWSGCMSLMTFSPERV